MRRLTILVPALALIFATAISVGAEDRAVRIIGDEQFASNQFIKSNFRFFPGDISVTSGSSVTWENRTDDEHTITLVDEAEVPDDFDGVFECRDPGGPCRAALDAHFATDPPTEIINVGAEGLDAPGDSLLIEEGSVTAVISAPSGTDLFFICAVHPWMQGKIEVE